MINFHKNIDIDVDQRLKSSTFQIACKKGCSKCCHNVFLCVSENEINSIVRSMNSLNFKIRKKIAKVISEIDKKWISKGTVTLNTIDDFNKYLIQQQKLNSYTCPLLLNNQCSIYQDRPAVCRIYHSSNESLCENLNADMNYIDIYKKYVQISENESGKSIMPSPLFRNIDFKDNKFISIWK